MQTLGSITHYIKTGQTVFQHFEKLISWKNQHTCYLNYDLPNKIKIRFFCSYIYGLMGDKPVEKCIFFKQCAEE